MNSIWVNYDLSSPGQEYHALISYLKTYKNYTRPTESSFLILTNVSVSDLRDEALKYLDSNDKFLAIKVTGIASWHNLTSETSQWIHGNLGE